MIITSAGLLVLALVLLIVGIVKSGVSYLVLSVFATLAAIGFLYASFVYYRNKAIMDGRLEPSPDGAVVAPGYPAAYTAGGVVTSVPSQNGSSHRVSSLIGTFESLPAQKAVEFVQTLNLDELHELRRFEVEHESRRPVLRAIDARVASIVALRRSLSDAP